MRPITIVHVADRAKVSVKTVSRVLNNEPNVTTELRERVMAAVDKLGYSPNMAARRLGGSKSWLLISFNDRELTIANWRSARGNNWIDQMLHGAMLACEPAGYHMMLELIDLDAADVERKLLSVLTSLRPDGVILTPPSSDHPAVLAALKKRGTPFVRIGSIKKGAGYRVLMDDVAASRDVTRYLLGLGHRRIGFITGSERFIASQLRVKSFLDTMAKAKAVVEEGWVQRGDFSFESGVAATEALLDLASPPTAIIASNDEMALAALQVAQKRKLVVPDQLSIVSFDDGAGVRISSPTLTALRQPVSEMAARAVELLINDGAVAGKPAQSENILPHELIVRESTSPPGKPARAA